MHLTPDKIADLTTVAVTWIMAFLPRLATAALILVAGYVISRWAARGITMLLARAAHVDVTITPILAAMVRYAILIPALIAALGQVGVETTSILAVLGAAGLAIGLALQGTLSNIAAGLMLIWLRPFHVGDYIETSSFSGTVLEIGLFVCNLRTGDGLFLFVPNSQIWNQWLKNHSQNPRRLVSADIVIRYKEDVEPARRALLALTAGDRNILQEPPPQVYVSSYGDSTITVTLRAWTRTETYSETGRYLPEATRVRLDKEGIDMPIPARPAPAEKV